MTAVLATYRLPEKSDFDSAWVGMEPTFQSKKSINKWWAIDDTPEAEDAYFEDAYMLKTEKKVVKRIRKKYRTWREERRHPFCMFESVELKPDRDQWKVRRQNLRFHWPDRRFRLYPDPHVVVDGTNAAALADGLPFGRPDRAFYLLGRAWDSDPGDRLPRLLGERYGSCPGTTVAGIRILCLTPGPS